MYSYPKQDFQRPHKKAAYCYVPTQEEIDKHTKYQHRSTVSDSYVTRRGEQTPKAPKRLRPSPHITSCGCDAFPEMTRPSDDIAMRVAGTLQMLLHYLLRYRVATRRPDLLYGQPNARPRKVILQFRPRHSHPARHRRARRKKASAMRRCLARQTCLPSSDALNVWST